MMRTLCHLALCGALLTSTGTQAQPPVWRGPDGKPVPETEAMKSKDGFAAALLITVDEDWRQKWDTPPETKPSFNQAETVPYGKKLSVLTFFSNPKLDAQGIATVTCDMQITAPNGKVTLDEKGLRCFNGRIGGSPYHLYLSAPVIEFTGDPGDPVGEWTVRAVLRDEVRQVSLPLSSTFRLTER